MPLFLPAKVPPFRGLPSCGRKPNRPECPPSPARGIPSESFREYPQLQASPLGKFLTDLLLVNKFTPKKSL